MELDKEDKKIIIVPKELNTISVISVIGELEEFLTNSETSTVILDFKNTSFVYPGGLTPLLSYLKDNLENNTQKHVYINSKNSYVDDYIKRMGFYSLLGLKDNYRWIKLSGHGKFQEPYYFSKDTTPEEVNKRSNNIINTFIKDRTAMYYNEAIGWCISEIIDNAQNHSNSNINVIMAQKYSNSNITEFCVSDRGIGIKASMGLSNTKLALEECITPAKGIHSTGMGNGLYYTTELIKNDQSGKCSMYIWTENKLLILHSNSVPVVKSVNAYWQGVNITISMYNGISESLTKLMNGQYSFSYENMPEYYENLFEN